MKKKNLVEIHPSANEWYDRFDIQTVDVLTQADGNRFYTVNKIKLPSVTTVAKVFSKDYIEDWKKRIGKKKASEITERAMDNGTKVHTLIENYLSGSDDLADTPKYHLTRLIPFLDSIEYLIFQEKVMWSENLGMAGRNDLLAQIDGKILVVDFKTAKEYNEQYGKNPAYVFQIKSYAEMCRERGIPVDGGLVVYVPEYGPFIKQEISVNHDDARQIKKIVAKWKKEVDNSETK